MAKVAAPGNDVSWAMQFEEEWFTRLECAKLSVAGRLPKIHFVSLLGAEIAEPIVIGHSDEEAHRQDYKSDNVLLRASIHTLAISLKC